MKAKPVPYSKVPMKFMDRDLMKVDPKKEQFAPTPACPINQHKRMAGAG